MDERITISNIKREAREQLLGNYSIAAGTFALLFVFSYIVMTVVSQALMTFAIGSGNLQNLDMAKAQALMSNGQNEMMFLILTYIVMGIVTPLISIITTGFTYVCREISYGRRPKSSDIFYCFKNHPDKVIIISLIIYVVQIIVSAPAQIYGNRFMEDSGESFLIYVVLLLAGAVVTIIINLMLAQSYLLYLDETELGAVDCLKNSISMMKGNKWRLFCLMLSFIGYGLLALVSLGIALFWIAPYQELTYINFYRDLKGEELRSGSCDDENGDVISED